MSIGNAIVNQALGAANKSMMGGLKKVMGNLPGTGLSGGKVSGLKTSGGGSINLSYPLDVEQNDMQGHYIMFMINTADPAIVKKDEEDRHAEALAAGFLGQDQQTGGVNVGGKNQERFRTAPKQALSIQKPSTVRLARAISLYMPPSIKSTYNTAYADTEMGALTTSLNELFHNSMNALESDEPYGGITMAGAGQAASEAAGAIGGTMLKNTAKGASLVGLGGAAGAVEIQLGKILSNKMELLFTGVGRRKFSFSFTFIPKSEKEAQVVHEIVHTFKKHMMPAFSSMTSPTVPLVGGNVSTSAQGRILSIPDSFDIQYMFHGGENPWINKISTCYLQQVDVQYGAGEKQTFYEPLTENVTGASGPPPQTTIISLAFEEIEKMSRERIEEGF